MPNRVFLALAAVSVLVLAPDAAAKGIERATICGIDACVTADQDDIGSTWLGDGSPRPSPSKAQPWYRAKLEMGDGRPGGRIFETFTVDVVLEADAIRSRDELGGSTWSSMSGAQRAVYRRLTAGLRPFPADQLKGVSNPSVPAANQAPPEPPAAPAEDDNGFPWLIVLGGVAALAAIALAFGLARRQARSDSVPRAEPLRR